MNIKKCGIILKDINNHQILLVFGKKSQKWGFPKGHMENGETEEETARRELKEETGIAWDGQYTNRIRFRNNIYFIVDVTKDDVMTQMHIEDVEEIEKIAWLSDNDIMKLPEYQCNFGLKNWIKKTEKRVF